MRKLLEITTGRHPFQVATAAACLLVGVAVLITNQVPPSVDKALPAPYGHIWLALVGVSGLATLTGSFWPGELDTGLITEGGGVMVLASALTVYGAAIFVISGLNGLAAGGFMLALGVASWWRAWQIVRDVRKVWRAQREGITADVRALADPGPPGGAP